MSCVFQNIDTPPPSPPGECAGGGHTALYSTYIEFSLGRGILSYVLILAGKDIAMTEVCSENDNRIFFLLFFLNQN
jgi:hypothetical protein